MPLKFSRDFVVPKSEVTPCWAMKPFHMLNMLQDAADGAVEAMNPPASYWTDGCGWMLLQYTIRLDRPLRAGDSGVIQTGHRMLHNLYSARRFEIYDAAGAQFGLADSKWVYVDLKTRRPQRLNHKLPDAFAQYEEDVIFEPVFVDPLKLDRVDSTTRLRVRLGELDVNAHVNNAYYLSWAAEAVPQEVYMTCGIISADIVYKHEALAGMELEVETQRDGLNFRHEIKSTGGELIAQFSTVWEKIPERSA